MREEEEVFRRVTRCAYHTCHHVCTCKKDQKADAQEPPKPGARVHSGAFLIKVRWTRRLDGRWDDSLKGWRWAAWLPVGPPASCPGHPCALPSIPGALPAD